MRERPQESHRAASQSRILGSRTCVVELSSRFVFVTAMASLLLAFSMGRLARTILLHRYQTYAEPQKLWHNVKRYRGSVIPDRHLPSPKALEGKEVPRTRYTSKNFGTGQSVTSTNLLIHSQRLKGEGSSSNLTLEDNEKAHAEHLPMGQHLLVDMNGVDSSFLNSEPLLASALLDTCTEAQMTVLSYHCHKMFPMGVSCIGVLLESHISFHTWPEEGVITLDLFTCGTSPLLPVLSVVKRMFAVPTTPTCTKEYVDSPEVLWSYRRRGFGSSGKEDDLQTHVLGDMGIEFKKEIASIETDYQEIDIFDVTRNGHHGRIDDFKKSLQTDGSYHAKHPELFSPDRLVFLDRVLQSRSYGEESYHESLVHPAMFAHAKPERVAIIGGGEGATLREVLKHKTVKNAIMIEIDEQMVNASIKHLPSWSDCSDLIGSANVCFHDPRTTMYYVDAVAWFVDRYSSPQDESSLQKFADGDLLDVVIIDDWDPNVDVKFSDELHTNLRFMMSLYNALSDGGVMVIQAGEAPSIFDPPDSWTPNENRATLTHLLETLGFESVLFYDDKAHSRLEGPWSYLIAFKEYKTRKKWFANEAEVEVALHQRSIFTKSGQLPFHFFDGGSMLSYQLAHKVHEATFCIEKSTTIECNTARGLNFSQFNAPASTFEVLLGVAANGTVEKIFTKNDISEGTYIAMEKGVEAVRFPPSTYRHMTEIFSKQIEAHSLNSVCRFVDDYGFATDVEGEISVSVDSSIIVFASRGFKSASNFEKLLPWEHTDAKESAVHRVFNPVFDRNLARCNTGTYTALRNIHSGEELLIS